MPRYILKSSIFYGLYKQKRTIKRSVQELVQKISQIADPFKKNGKHTDDNSKLFEGVHNNYLTLS